jgi:hypothetical protein
MSREDRKKDIYLDRRGQVGFSQNAGGMRVITIIEEDGSMVAEGVQREFGILS